MGVVTFPIAVHCKPHSLTLQFLIDCTFAHSSCLRLILNPNLRSRVNMGPPSKRLLPTRKACINFQANSNSVSLTAFHHSALASRHVVAHVSPLAASRPASRVRRIPAVSMCALHCLLLYCGVAPVLQFVNRMSMREKYGMESNGCGDCLTAFCCACCELIQEDKETIIRTTGMDPKTEQPYVPPQGMTYP